MTWHTDPAVLDAYLAGTLDVAQSASVEAHTTTCAHCRAAVAERADLALLEDLWVGVLDRVESGRLPWATRLLVRFGVSEADARLVATTPGLTVAWLLAALALLVAAVAVAATVGGPREARAFLVLAPLVPLAGVVAAYRPVGDPSREMTVATPYPVFRLVALRCAAVCLTSLLGVLAVGLLLPLATATAMAWLLPALVLSLVCFSLLSRYDVLETGVAVALAWLLVVAVWGRWSGDVLAAFRPTAQLLWAALAVVAAAAAYAGRGCFEGYGGRA